MIAGVARRLVATAAPATRPGPATAAAIDPSVVVEAPGEVRAAGSFVAVLLLGGVLLYRYGGFVDRSVDASMERPRVAVVYGLMAFALVAFIGGYALTQLARFGAGGPVLAGVAAAGLAALVLAALGFLVVGTLLTDMEGRRRPRYGLVLGAGLSAVGWLLLPPVGGAVVWVLLAAFGVGGATRRWFHTPRRVDRATED